MNYFELHIGDYEKGTAHLSAVEDGIYGRLLRRYYDTEAPLPVDLKAVQRLVRARSRDEKEAVATVLEEFFDEASDGWHHGRCDIEIARFQEKRVKAQRSANARWSQPQLLPDAMRTDSERNANASETHDERNAHQTPDTKHQSPDPKLLAPDTPQGEPVRRGITPAGLLAVALNRAGVRCTSQQPFLIDAAQKGVTAQGLIELHDIHPDKPAAYLVKIAVRELTEVVAPTTGATHATRQPSDRPSLADQVRRSSNDDDPDGAIDGTATRLPR